MNNYNDENVNIVMYKKGAIKVAEVISDQILIGNVEDGLQLIIIGEFSKYPGKSIRDFLPSIAAAKDKLFH